jgi:hypothetical protein
MTANHFPSDSSSALGPPVYYHLLGPFMCVMISATLIAAFAVRCASKHKSGKMEIKNAESSLQSEWEELSDLDLERVQSLRFLIPGRLGFMFGPSNIQHLRNKCMNGRPLKFISADLRFPSGKNSKEIDHALVRSFCTSLAKRISHDPRHVWIFCLEEESAETRADASFLLGTYMMLHHDWTQEAAIALFHST